MYVLIAMLKNSLWKWFRTFIYVYSYVAEKQSQQHSLLHVIANDMFMANSSTASCMLCLWLTVMEMHNHTDEFRFWILSHPVFFLCQGWDDPYVPRTHEGLLKWKYPEMNSVDFLFEVVLCSPSEQSCCYFLLILLVCCYAPTPYLSISFISMLQAC